MDKNFFQRATDIELRLEAEGMFLTAEAIRQVVNAYVVELSKNIGIENGRNKSLVRLSLTGRQPIHLKAVKN